VMSFRELLGTISNDDMIRLPGGEPAADRDHVQALATLIGEMLA
jgi:hypothetical protein